MEPQFDAHGSTFNQVGGHQINLRNSSNISIEIYPASIGSDSGVAVAKAPGYIARKLHHSCVNLTNAISSSPLRSMAS